MIQVDDSSDSLKRTALIHWVSEDNTICKSFVDNLSVCYFLGSVCYGILLQYKIAFFYLNVF